jgi:hypothetical protein
MTDTLPDTLQNMVADLQNRWGGTSREVIERAVQASWATVCVRETPDADPSFTSKAYMQFSVAPATVHLFNEVKTALKLRTNTETLVYLTTHAHKLALPPAMVAKYVAPPKFRNLSRKQIGAMVPPAVKDEWDRIYDTRALGGVRATFETILAEAWINLHHPGIVRAHMASQRTEAE